MQATVVYPKNKLIRQYIQYFLFIKNDDPLYRKSHICFPNTNCCIGLHRGNKLISISESDYILSKTDGYHSYLTGIYQKPLAIHSSGPFDEVCIDFEPLGIEMLTGQKLSSFTFLDAVIETVLPNHWQTIFDAAFLEAPPKIRAEHLEQFFLRKLSMKTKFNYIPFNQIHEDSVAQLKNTFHLSYRSIHRLYRDSLDMTPKEFLNISRFRKGINQLNQVKKLTQVAYEIGYSDQSHMIREFKKYSGFTPKTFLKKSSTVDNNVWWHICEGRGARSEE